MAAVTISVIATFFSGEEKLIKKGENAYKSKRLEKFSYDGSTGTITATVHASMKDKSYNVYVCFIYATSTDHNHYICAGGLLCRGSCHANFT